MYANDPAIRANGTADLTTLVAAYDPLLDNPDFRLSQPARQDLMAQSQVFDLETPPEGSDADIWRKLRRVLILELPEDGDPSRADPGHRRHALDRPVGRRKDLGRRRLDRPPRHRRMRSRFA